jgi:hypothetical protein
MKIIAVVIALVLSTVTALAQGTELGGGFAPKQGSGANGGGPTKGGQDSAGG